MLDDLMPHSEFAERHRRVVAASPEQTWGALASLTMADLTVTRPLLALRHLSRAPRGPSGPLLTHGPVTLLHLGDDDRVAVAGAVAQPWRPRAPRRRVTTLQQFAAFDEPGWTKYLTEFRVVGHAGGSEVSTQTRGVSTDSAARRRFRVYWLPIRLPSGLVRRDVLRAVARAAEGPGGAQSGNGPSHPWLRRAPSRA